MCEKEACLWEDEECQTRTALDNILNFHSFLVSHEAKDGENDTSGVKRGERVHRANHESVPEKEIKLI